jgi:hypothetical protein
MSLILPQIQGREVTNLKIPLKTRMSTFLKNQDAGNDENNGNDE